MGKKYKHNKDHVSEAIWVQFGITENVVRNKTEC